MSEYVSRRIEGMTVLPRFRSVSAALASAALTATSAAAGSIVASDPVALQAYFLNEGVPMKLTEDEQGDPLLQGRYYGTRFSIYFFGCTGGKECTSIQYHAGYGLDGPVPLDILDGWNRDYRYARAYRDGASDAAVHLEYDVFLGEKGLDEADFAETFTIWTGLIEDFEKLLETY